MPRCSLYRRLLALRANEPALQIGDYAPADLPGDILAYTRSFGAKRFLIALNLSPDRVTSPLPPHFANGRLLISTSNSSPLENLQSTLDLGAWEGQLLAIAPPRPSENEP